MRLIAKVMLVALALGACSPRGQVIIDPAAATADGKVQKIFFGTSRGLSESGAFGRARSEHLTLGQYNVSVPPERERGQINWPKYGRAPDPTTDFITTEAGRYRSTAGFRSDLSRDLRQKDGNAVVFLHGFNNNFAEGLYRNVQIAHDLDIPSSVIHYSWPSAAQPLGYVYDRDSSLYARDGLVQLLHEIKASGAKKIVLIAHSMGSNLLMETLRSLSLANDTNVMDSIGGVVLISPDIDVDLFHAQARAIKKMPKPFVVFSSEKDRILQLSSLLTGMNARLGTLTDMQKIADLPIIILDTAAFSQGAGHFNLGDNPVLLKIFDGLSSIDEALSDERMSRTGLIPGAVLTVQNATQIVLSPVLK